MENTVQLVMFDLDGTLVETGLEIALAVNDTLLHFDFAPVTAYQVSGWIGYGTLELLIQALAYATQSSAGTIRSRADLVHIRQEFDRNYQLHCGTISRLYPRVLEVLVQLKSRGVKLAVITNKEIRYTNIVLKFHKLTELFEFVIGGDSLPTKKPDPAGVKQCLNYFGITSDRALFIGDSSIDAATARNAGVPVWLLTYGYNMNQDVKASAPDRIVDDISPLLG